MLESRQTDKPSGYRGQDGDDDGSEIDPTSKAFKYGSASSLVQEAYRAGMWNQRKTEHLRAIACMIWPHLLSLHATDAAMMVLKMQNEGIRMQLFADVGTYQPLFGLMFELMFGQKNLPFDFWTGELVRSNSKNHLVGWPIPRWNSEHYTRHPGTCTDFPFCLDRLSYGPLHAAGISYASYTWKILTQLWAFHTMNESNCGSVIYTPPRLIRLARWAIRLAIVQANFTYALNPIPQEDGKHCLPTANRSRMNYVQMVQTLDIPANLKDYLLFTELWTADRSGSENVRNSIWQKSRTTSDLTTHVTAVDGKVSENSPSNDI